MPLLSRDPYAIPITDPLDHATMAELLAMAYHEGYTDANTFKKKNPGLFPVPFVAHLENMDFARSATLIVQTRINTFVKAPRS